jgi:hypothetical protein
MRILKKIEELKQVHSNWEEALTRKAKQYKVADAMISLRDNIAIKKIVEELTLNVNAINSKLLSHDVMSEVERDLLLCDRERCEWFLLKFPSAEAEIKNIKKFIQKYE